MPGSATVPWGQAGSGDQGSSEIIMLRFLEGRPLASENSSLQMQRQEDWEQLCSGLRWFSL